jgi:chromosomal replication initiator protein
LEWRKVSEEIENKFGKEEYEKWLKDIRLKYSYDDEVVMIVETKFVRDWIRREYLEKLKDIWKKHDEKIKKTQIVSDEEFVI